MYPQRSQEIRTECIFSPFILPLQPSLVPSLPSPHLTSPHLSPRTIDPPHHIFIRALADWNVGKAIRRCGEQSGKMAKFTPFICRTLVIMHSSFPFFPLPFSPSCVVSHRGNKKATTPLIDTSEWIWGDKRRDWIMLDIVLFLFVRSKQHSRAV